MPKPRVFVSRRIPEAGLVLLRDACEADVWPGEAPPPSEAILERIKGVKGILCLSSDRMDGEVMDAAGAGLRVISNYAVGYDNVDVPAATERGIPVGNTPDVLTATTADFAFALLMAAARRLVEADKYVRSGCWSTTGPRLLLGQDVTGATLGIVGFGRIGRSLAKRAQGFDMKVLYYDPYYLDDARAAQLGAQAVDLDTLLRKSDFVSLHTPLTEETYHLIDRAALSKMKSTAVLINTARGPIVEPDALSWALRAGAIAYAGLDVTEPEPIEMDSPLLELDNVIISPHIASATVATRDKMAKLAAENLIAGLEGRHLPHCVNPEVYER